jgi:hypothetical protein
MALALFALAYGCPAKDDVSVNVVKEGSGMAGMGGAPAGSGGTPAMTPMGTGGMAEPCPIPPWYNGFSVLKAHMCRIAKDDPLVQQVMAYFMSHMNDVPPVKEGDMLSRCDFNYPLPYYIDTNFPEQYTVCPAWCTLFDLAAAAAYDQHRMCCAAAGNKGL